MLENLLFALTWKLESVSVCQTNYVGFLLNAVTRNPDKVQTRKGLDFLFKGYLYGKKPSMDSLQISVFTVYFSKITILHINFQDYQFPNCLTEICKSH